MAPSTSTGGPPDSTGPPSTVPSDLSLDGWRDVARAVWREIGEDRLVLASAGVAFFGFLSLIPAMAATLSVIGLILDPESVTEQTETLLEPLPDDARSLLESQLESLAGQAGGALSVSLIVSFVLALWAASSGMGNLIEGVSLAYDARGDRGFVARRAIAIAFTLGSIVFLLFVIGGLTALPGIMGALDVPGWLRTVVEIGFFVAIAVGFSVGLGLLYRYGPDRQPPGLRWLTWGSAIAVALWFVASLGFRFYAASFGSYNETYGSLAAVAVLLTWLLISALAVLIGAEINAQLEIRTGHRTGQETSRDTGRATREDTARRPATEGGDTAT